MDKGGRPLIFNSPDELQQEVNAYFISTDKPTLSGLAVFLGIDRQTLYNYKERDGFFDILKAATDRVESIYEERLIYTGQPTGVIFALKNMGWKDQTQTDITSGGDKITGFNYLPPNADTDTVSNG